MSLAARVADWIDPGRAQRLAAEAHARAATQPIEIVPRVGSAIAGTGVGNQPRTEDLLREARGVFDMGQRAIANRVAELEPQVLVKRRERDGTEIEEILDDHPLKMLLDRPHPNLSRAQIFALMTKWLTATGKASLLKVNASALRVPVELHPIPPTHIDPVWRAGVIAAYIVRDGNGGQRTLEPDCVVHFYIPDPEQFWGAEGYLGPNGVTADTLKFGGLSLRKKYRHNAVPPVVIKAGERIPDPEQQKAFYDAWRARFHTVNGSERGLPAMIPSDADLIAIASESGADVVPLLEFLREDQLMSVGVPRVVLGNVVAGDRSSCDASQFGFDRYTVKPVAGLIEHALTMQLASDFDPSLIVRFAPFVSQDQDFELRREEQDLRTKVRSINQVREDRGLDPATWGDDPVGTLAEIPYDPAGLDDLPDDDQDALGDRTMNAPRSGAPSRAAVPVVSRGAFTARAEWERQVRRERKFVPRFTRTMRAIFRDQRDSVLRRLDQSDSERASHVRITADDLFNEEEWREIFEDRVEPLRTAIYTEVVEATLVELDGVVQFDFTETQAAVLRRQGAQLVANVNRTTRAKLARQLEIATVEGESIDQIARRVREVFDVRRNQARTIARTEVLKASQEAQVTAFEVSDVVERKQWNTSLDGSVRDEHAPTEGQIVGLREPFTLGDGEQADAPGIGAFGGVLSAHNSINCRCFVTPVFGKEG